MGQSRPCQCHAARPLVGMPISLRHPESSRSCHVCSVTACVLLDSTSVRPRLHVGWLAWKGPRTQLPACDSGFSTICKAGLLQHVDASHLACCVCVCVCACRCLRCHDGSKLARCLWHSILSARVLGMSQGGASFTACLHADGVFVVWCSMLAGWLDRIVFWHTILWC